MRVGASAGACTRPPALWVGTRDIGAQRSAGHVVSSFSSCCHESQKEHGHRGHPRRAGPQQLT